MKPDWKDAPEWAEWLAMDRDGQWYWYEDRPIERGAAWDFTSASKVSLAKIHNWQQTLEERPI